MGKEDSVTATRFHQPGGLGRDSGIPLQRFPGIKKEDLKIAVRNGYLVVSASFNKKSDEGKGKYIHFERETGSFSRSFYVGENVRTKDVSAKSENGVLLITIPKKVEREDKDEFVQIQ